MELNNYKFTIAIIGKRKVGKSDLLYTIFKNERDGSSLPVRDKQSIHYILGKRVEDQIWDTCEDPRFQSLLTIVYNCANGLFLCFDITNKQSFLALDNEVISAMEFEKSRPKKVIIIGTKCDSNEKREVTKEEIKLFTEKYKLPYFECSMITGKGIWESIYCMIREMINQDELKEYPYYVDVKKATLFDNSDNVKKY